MDTDWNSFHWNFQAAQRLQCVHTHTRAHKGRQWAFVVDSCSGTTFTLCFVARTPRSPRSVHLHGWVTAQTAEALYSNTHGSERLRSQAVLPGEAPWDQMQSLSENICLIAKWQRHDLKRGSNRRRLGSVLHFSTANVTELTAAAEKYLIWGPKSGSQKVNNSFLSIRCHYTPFLHSFERKSFAFLRYQNIIQPNTTHVFKVHPIHEEMRRDA